MTTMIMYGHKELFFDHDLNIILLLYTALKKNEFRKFGKHNIKMD